MRNEVLQIADPLITAVFNGLAQGVILVLFVALSLRLFGQTNAATRYIVWWATLVFLLLLLPANYYLPGRTVVMVQGTTREHENPTSGPAVDASLSAESIPSDLPPQTPTAEPPVQLPSAAAEPAGGWAGAVGRRLRSWNVQVISALPPTMSLVLLGSWSMIAAIRMILLLRGIHRLGGMKATSSPVNQSLEDLFQRLRADLRVRRAVELAVSTKQQSPVVVGFLHPKILLPAEDLAIEGILAHELAHVRRFDDWTNLIQHVIQSLVFFHPGVWWVSRQLSLEREIACDDFALQQGRPARAYALLLIEAARRWKEPVLQLAPGVSTNHSQLQHRINMILNTNRNTSPRLGKLRLGFITSAAALAATLAFVLGPRLVRAEPLEAAPEAASVTVQTTAAELAQADAIATSTPSDVAPGPKAKAADASGEASVSDSTSSNDKGTSMTPRAARHHRNTESIDGNASVEDRLDRLERMVKSLVAQQNPKVPRPALDFRFTPDGQNQFQYGNKEFNELAKRNAELADQAKQMAKLSQDEVARAMEKVRRASKQAEAARHSEDDWRGNGGLMEKSLQSQVRILEKQRDTLQREVEKLQREIERIQQQRERIDEKAQRHGEAKEPREPREPKQLRDQKE